MGWLRGRTLLLVSVALAAFLPLILFSLPAGSASETLAGGWQTIFQYDFSGGIGYGSGWTTLDNNGTSNGEFYWNTETYTYTSPSVGVWAVGGGINGSLLNPATDTYTNNVDSWLVYGPLDLRQAFQAEMTFNYWLDSSLEDAVYWCAATSNSVSALQANCQGGMAGHFGQWASATLNLNSVTRSGTVYIAFRFTSNNDGNVGRGVFVDDVVVRTYGYTSYLPRIARDPTPTPSYYADNFSGSTPWAVVETTGSDGPVGDDWYRVWNEGGYMRAWINDGHEHIVASPGVRSIPVPFEIQTRILFQQRAWSSGFAILFGSDTPDFSSGNYYRINFVYVDAGTLKYQIKRCRSLYCKTGDIITGAGDDGNGYIYLYPPYADGRQWNNWRVVRTSSRISLYANNYLVADYSWGDISGRGYFGVMLSTWEFPIGEIWVDYFNVMPH